MSKRIYTTTPRKEQLKLQVFQMMRIIRRKLDADVLRMAQEIAQAYSAAQPGFPSAATTHDETSTTAGTAKPVGKDGAPKAASVSQAPQTIPYDQENARQAIAHFIALKKGNRELCTRLMQAMRSSSN